MKKLYITLIATALVLTYSLTATTLNAKETTTTNLKTVQENTFKEDIDFKTKPKNVKVDVINGYKDKNIKPEKIKPVKIKKQKPAKVKKQRKSFFNFFKSKKEKITNNDDEKLIQKLIEENSKPQETPLTIQKENNEPKINEKDLILLQDSEVVEIKDPSALYDKKVVKPAIVNEIKPVKDEKVKPVKVKKEKPVKIEKVRPVKTEKVKPVKVKKEKPVKIEKVRPAKVEKVKPVKVKKEKPVKAEKVRPAKVEKIKPVSTNIKYINNDKFYINTSVFPQETPIYTPFEKIIKELPLIRQPFYIEK